MLSEAMLLALVGGALALLVVTMVFDGFESSTIVGSRQVSFQFAVTPASVLTVLGLSFGMSLVGGLFPAIRAARQPIAAALREE